MKKHNFVFLGECGIILALLLLIGVLVKDERQIVQGKEAAKAFAEEQTYEENELWAEHFLPEQQEEEVTKSLGTDEENHSTVSNSENTLSANSVSEKIAENEDAHKIKIAVFGDSIWNADRGEDGISELVMEQLKNVKIYNCAIGGTTAAVKEESTRHDEWTSRSFNGMMYIATDIVSASELIGADTAYEVIQDVDFEEVDYVIVSYGLNDYFSDIPVYPKEYYDMTSYVGALRHGIQKLKEKYPQMKFILTSPTYCEWFKGERQYELGTYVEAARSVATEMEVYFLDMYHALGDTPNEKTEYLSDGVHLSKEGRQIYADCVIEYLKSLEEGL